MADIFPFRGTRYNSGVIDDISSVICPPYDIISPEMELELQHRSDFNFIKIEHGQQLPSDTSDDNRYTRSAAILQQWLKEGILKEDELPAIYIHHYCFTYNDIVHERMGIIASVRLENWDKMIIRPHESTRGKPKDDRLKLLWALQANTSPVFAMFENHGNEMSFLLDLKEKEQPVIDLTSSDEKHRIWAVTDPQATERISRVFSQIPLYIADGHHRYESALTYMKERHTCSPNATGNEGFNFVMMELVELNDPGLIILSPHRLVRGIHEPTLSKLRSRLTALFQIEEIPLNKSNMPQQIDDLLTDDQTARNRIVLFGLAMDSLLLLELKDPVTAGKMVPYFHSELYKSLDVSIVDHIILEEILALTSDREESSLAFNHSTTGTMNDILSHKYQLAFFLGPVKTETIKEIADIGDRMPRKSTYFYPKPPSGLVFRRLE
jgi:uncharacterized protein (DUF1015 family)